MKKLFLLLACVATYIAACTMTVNAQTKMHIWMQGGNIPFALAAIDSVTFSGYAEEEFTLSETSLSLYVGESYQLTANKPVDQWMSSDPTVATVTDGFITAVSEGTAIIAATAGNQTRTCVVKVIAPIEEEHPAEVKGSEIWPIVMDATTFEANASKVKGDFRVDDTYNFLYIWSAGETYVAGECAGKNFFGNNDGYLSLVVAAPDGWSGAGLSLGDASAAAAETLRQAIVANPDSYYLHIGIKATTPGNHQIYTFNDDATSFAIGTATIDRGVVIGDFTRDGSWAEFDIPMSQFATALSSLTFRTNNNIFCVLSGGTTGSQLDLDAVYFYKKGTTPDQTKGTIMVTPETLNMRIGDEERLQATIDPAPTTSVKLNWVSSDPAVATVLNGVVKTEGFGTAKIIVFADGYTADTCVVNVNNDAMLDNYQLSNYGIFGTPTMLEGTEREIEMTSGATYKCQLGYTNLYVWDNNITLVNGNGFSGKGYFFQTEVAILWIVEGDFAGYYVSNSDGFKIAPANPQDTIPYSGKSGELVDVQKYGEFWDQYLLTTENTTDEEWQNLYTNYYYASQTGTQIYQIDFDNDGAQSYNLGNVTAAHFNENEKDELQYSITIDWYDHVNDNRFYGLACEFDAGGYVTGIVKPYDMRTIHKEYTNIVETPAEAPAKKVAKAAVLGNPERLHLDANYAVEQVNNMKAKVQLHK